jgi:hypothetical protein
MIFSLFKQDWSGLINFDLIIVAICMELFCEFMTHENFIVFVTCSFYITNFDGWIIHLGI